MKASSSILFLLLLVIAVLMVINSLLYQQNRTYKTANRELIIKNDSILSVNLELNHVINRTVNNGLVSRHEN
jgi:cell division protein FtsL